MSVYVLFAARIRSITRVNSWILATCCWFMLATTADGETNLTRSLHVIRTKHKLPAFAAAVVIDGQLSEYAAVGERRLGGKVKVTRDDKFHLGSCTKALTDAMIGILVDKGRLRWDSKLTDVLTDMADDIHQDYHEVTLEHLLAHRAGFPKAEESFKGIDPSDLPKPPRKHRWEYIRQWLKKPAEFKVGTKFQYSNVGYTIAGVMAETVTDKSWETLMSELVFQPLEMRSAGFGAMGIARKLNQPWPHMTRSGKTVPVMPGPNADNPDAIAPGGKIHCSLADWAKFVQVFLGGAQSGQPLLKPATLERLQTPSFGGVYAGGWVVTEQDWAAGKALTHSGSNTMNYCTAWLAPQRRFAVLVATNCGGANAAVACDEAAHALIQKYSDSKGKTAGVTANSKTRTKTSKSDAGEDTSMTTLAQTWFRRVQRRRLPNSKLSPQLQKLFASKRGRDFCAALRKLGRPSSFNYHSRREMGATTVYVYKLTFGTQSWRWEIGFDKQKTVTLVIARSPFEFAE